MLAVSPAEAADQPPSADAHAVAEQARQAYAAGRTLEAIDGYKRAYELSGDTSLLFRLGELNREIGNDVAAARFYRTYLAREPRGKDREAAERAARRLELGTSPPPPAIRPPQARTVPPPPADGPPPPSEVPAPPADARESPATQAAPPPSVPPPAESRAAPSVDLQAAATPAPAAGPSPPLPRWLPWVGLGATLGLGAGAVVTGLGASHRYDELRASCGRTPDGCAPGDINQVKSRALIANLLWAATGVSAVATGVMVFANTHEAGFSGVWSY